MNASWLHSAWAKRVATFATLLVLGLAPWPGWGEAWADFYCEVANVVASVVPSSSVRALVQPGDDPSRGEERRPWQIYVYVQRVDTGAVDRLVRNKRMDYVSVVTFLALAGASALHRWRTRALWTVGLPALLAAVALNDLNGVVLALARLRWVSLRPAIEVPLSALYTLVNGLTITPFALPALMWAYLLRRGNIGAPWRRAA